MTHPEEMGIWARKATNKMSGTKATGQLHIHTHNAHDHQRSQLTKVRPQASINPLHSQGKH